MSNVAGVSLVDAEKRFLPDLQKARLARLRGVSESLSGSHSKIQETKTQNPKFYDTYLIALADLAMNVYSMAWDKGELTPATLASPSWFKPIWQRYPEMGIEAHREILSALARGEGGEPKPMLRLIIGGYDPDSDGVSTAEQLAVCLVMAKYQVAAVIHAARDDAAFLVELTDTLNIVDSSSMGVFKTLPMRMQYMQSTVREKFGTELEAARDGLSDNWWKQRQVAMGRLVFLEEYLLALYATAVEPMGDKHGWGRGA